MQKSIIITFMFFVLSVFLTNAYAIKQDEKLQVVGTPGPIQHPEQLIRVYSLQHSTVSDVVELLGQLLNQQNVRMTADARTNSLIVSAEKEYHEKIIEILLQLDRPDTFDPGNAEANLLKIFHLEHKSAKAVLGILQSLMHRTPNLRMEADTISERIYVQGPLETLNIIEELIAKIDEPSEKAIQKQNNVYVAISLIVDGGQIRPDAQESGGLNKTISDLLGDAKSKGLLNFQEPIVAASSVTRVRTKHRTTSQNNDDSVSQNANSGRKFRNSSESKGGQFNLESFGSLVQQDNGKFLIYCEVEIAAQVDEQTRSKASLSAEIEAPLDHPVLLSFSSVGGINSAVIIQVISAD